MRSRAIVLVAALAAAALGAGCASRPAAPAAAPTGERSVTPGKFVWHDLVTDSPEACRRFYASLLGWEFDDVERLGKPYAIARQGTQRVAGLVAIDKSGPEKRSQWVAYVSVADVDKAVADATRAGGRTLVSSREIAT